MDQFLASEVVEAGSIFDDLQNSLSTQQGELASLARELRHVCALSFPSICLRIFFYTFLTFRIFASTNLIFHLLLALFCPVAYKYKRDSISVLNKQRIYLSALKDLWISFWKNQKGLKTLHLRLMKCK